MHAFSHFIQHSGSSCQVLGTVLGSSSEQGKIPHPFPYETYNLPTNSSDGMIQIISKILMPSDYKHQNPTQPFTDRLHLLGTNIR